jgi:transposase
MKRRNYSQVNFEHLSIDEKSFKKGHHYMTVLSHPSFGCVIDVEEDRTKESYKRLFNKSLAGKQVENVVTINVNMWKSYIKTAKEILPIASLVHDIFHLVKYLNDAIDKVRRREATPRIET